MSDKRKCPLKVMAMLISSVESINEEFLICSEDCEWFIPRTSSDEAGCAFACAVKRVINVDANVNIRS